MDSALLQRLLDEGLSVAEIARRVSRDPTTVGYWLRRHGLTANGHDRHAPRGAPPRAALAALVARDLSVRELARELDRSPATVRYWLGRYGLSTSPAARSRRRPASAPGFRQPGRCPRHGEVAFVRERTGRATCARCRAEAVTEWRRRAKRLLVAEAGGRCVLCGYDRSVVALQFHHVDPAAKCFGLGGRGLARGLETLRREAAKCVLLCANCHAEVEAGIASLPAPTGCVDGPG